MIWLIYDYKLFLQCFTFIFSWTASVTSLEDRKVKIPLNLNNLTGSTLS